MSGGVAGLVEFALCWLGASIVGAAVFSLVAQWFKRRGDKSQ